LCSHPDFKSKIKSNFDHIFIDEFQDTNIIQNEILKQIQNNNICIIGDPYQSIYGFLGGNVDNILGAPKDYNAKVIQLMENYRSNQNIVDYTNYLASKMIESVDSWIPNISSSGVKNNKIGVMLYTDESQQRQFITDTIKGLGQRKTYAIISRSGFDFITEKFLNHNKIKFNKLGGLSLKESVEVQSFTMLYTYVLNTDKLNALAYVLPRVEGIGETSVDGYIKDLKSKESKKKTPKKIQEFLDKLNNQLEVNAKPKTNSEVVSLTLRIKSIYDEYIIPKITKSWKEDRVKLAKQKVAVILEELMEQKNYIEVSTTLDDYYFDKNEKRDEQKSNVTVSTIHSAKGLEWDVVFLVDWESKSFNRDDIKEAQRLNYVAVSRAKEELFLLSGDSIFELPKEVINSDTLGHLFEKIEVSDKEDKESTTINFGKYKGYDVSELPPSYLYWLYENKVDFKKKKLLTDSLIKTIEKMIF
jgi:DNA helicase-2/ATP-dependent DNA helicase PcrA